MMRFWKSIKSIMWYHNQISYRIDTNCMLEHNPSICTVNVLGQCLFLYCAAVVYSRVFIHTRASITTSSTGLYMQQLC